MKETVRSLKLYFIVVSALGIAGSIASLGALQENPLFLVTGLIGLAFSIAYLYIGIRLRQLLAESPKFIENMLLVSMAYQVLSFFLGLLNGFQTGLFMQLAIALLILWYLLANVRRLSRELTSK